MKKINRITLEPAENGCIGTVHCEYDGVEGQSEHKYNMEAGVFDDVVERMGLKAEHDEQGAASPDVAPSGKEKPKLHFDPKKYK